METKPKDPSEYTEAEVRQLRANIWGDIPQRSWNLIRGTWMKPAEIEWLIKNQPPKKEPWKT